MVKFMGFWGAQRPSVFIITLVSVAIILLLLIQPSQSSQRLISQWQPTPMITRPDLPSERPNAPPPAPISGATVPVATADLSVADGLYPDERPALADDVQRAVGYVTARFGTQPRERFTAALLNDASCGLHGVAYTDVRTMQVYTCPSISRDRAIAILAHEVVHQLEHDRYGPAHLSADLILSEGAATWGAGDYWLGGHPDFRSYVRALRQNSALYPLATHYSGLGIAAMNTLYYQWASFVDYLISIYGREKFDQVYVTGHNDPGSADYAGVYGKDLGTLEQEWLAWLD